MRNSKRGHAAEFYKLDKVWNISFAAHIFSLLEHVAHFNATTSLPNRVLLADRLQQAKSRC